MEIRAIEQTSTYYPNEWQTLSDKPQTLYAVGNIELLKSRKLTVVGSRRTPKSALILGERLTNELSGSFAIVSGAADGGDSAAISGALESGNVICVLAGGFSALPQGNLSLLEKVMQKGLVVSPHDYDTPVRNFSYTYRNKLLAALGEATLVLGAGEKSGALVTAKYAEEFQKPVFALPYAPGSPVGAGCNALIKRGGYLTENAADVFKRLGVEYTERNKVIALTEPETQMLSALKEIGDGHITEISAKSGVPVFKARAILSALQVKGLVFELGGNRFSIT